MLLALALVLGLPPRCAALLGEGCREAECVTECETESVTESEWLTLCVQVVEREREGEAEGEPDCVGA